MSWQNRWACNKSAPRQNTDYMKAHADRSVADAAKERSCGSSAADDRERGDDGPECADQRALAAFLAKLVSRSAEHRRLPQHAALLLAEAALRYLPTRPLRPPQIVVLGPTQVGKSTLVNLLLGSAAAGVSPLAGYTVHPQGFAVEHDADASWTRALFPRMVRRAPTELSREALDGWSLVGAADANARRLPACTVWDTPDFDSLAARGYLQAVLECAALADVHVLVLSKEKYADLSVWNVLSLLAALGSPLVVCLNKLTPEAAEPVVASLSRRLRALEPYSKCALIELPQVAGDARQLAEALRGPAQAICARVAACIPRPAGAARRGAVALLRRHWDDWCAPLRSEHAAAGEYAALVEAGLAAALQAYQRDFLEHPERYDTFRRATVELLRLLEVPGVGAALDGARRMITWPARTLLSAGREWWRARNPHARARLSGEQRVLQDTLDRTLASLQRDLARRLDGRSAARGFWHALGERLIELEPELRSSFEQAASAHEQTFAREIEAAAQRLYQHLQRAPMTLNALRAARASVDLGAIALAIKTGGAHLNDLLLAPALFGLTSMLAEGALGSYMRRVADELKQRQLQRVRDTLLEATLGRPLRAACENLTHADLWGIPADELVAAEQALQRWESAAPGSAVHG